VWNLNSVEWVTHLSAWGSLDSDRKSTTQKLIKPENGLRARSATLSRTNIAVVAVKYDFVADHDAMAGLDETAAVGLEAYSSSSMRRMESRLRWRRHSLSRTPWPSVSVTITAVMAVLPHAESRSSLWKLQQSISVGWTARFSAHHESR
jgi:hypothetical protein